jgi:hypothetical protein
MNKRDNKNASSSSSSFSSFSEVRGSALVEFAVVVPVFVLILSGLMLVGRWYLVKNRLVMLSQYGAGLKQAGRSQEDIRRDLREEVSGGTWETLTVEVKDVPVAAFFPSTSHWIMLQVEPFRTPWAESLFGTPYLKEQELLTVDPWPYGVPTLTSSMP